MNDTLEIREARADEIALVQELVRGMAKYEKRPEDMTGTQESLSYWLFERKIATILLLEYEKKVIGYAIYYPVFGSFAACGGKAASAEGCPAEKAEGYSRMEWSCLDWNTPSLAFYEKLGAAYDSGRKYLELPL